MGKGKDLCNDDITLVRRLLDEKSYSMRKIAYWVHLVSGVSAKSNFYPEDKKMLQKDLIKLVRNERVQPGKTDYLFPT